MTYESITTEMIQAVSDEIEAMKEGGSGRDIPVYDGFKTGMSAGQYLYEFVAAYELVVPDDAPALLKVGEKSYEVTVVATEGFEITLATSEDLGLRIPLAALNVAPYFLLERLRDRLNEARDRRLSVNRDMTLTLFNQLGNVPLPGSPEPDFDSLKDAPPANEEQRESVRRALSQRITFIWGPPGTGKTTTVNYLVPSLLKGGERVLITSHTNAAVDQVLKAAMKGMSKQEVEDGAIVRLGQPKEASEIQYILLPEVVKRKTAALQDVQKSLEQRLASAREEERKWAWWEGKFKEMARLANERQKRETQLCHLRDEAQRVGTRLSRAQQYKEELEAKLQDARTSGFLRRLLLGLNPEKIKSQIGACATEIARLQQELEAKRREIANVESLMARLDDEQRRVQLDMAMRGPVPSVQEVLSNLERCRKHISELSEKIDDIVRKIATVPFEVVRQARVVGATLSKLATTKELYETHFDTIIVDEVSMTPQPYLWFCSGLAEKRVVLLGDFRQLPPICLAETPVARARIARNIFEEAGIVDNNGRIAEGDGRLCKLRKQYRMHRVIGDLANALVYEGDGNSLKHHASCDCTKKGRLAEPRKSKPLLLYDTSSVDPWCARQSVGYSRYNIYSAALAVRVSKMAVLSSDDVGVGIICPYAAQARLIQQLVTAEGLHNRVKVATVHRFQGNEKDIIIIDLVDGKPFEPAKLLIDSQASCLLNVSVTRARGKLVVISNVDYFRQRVAEGPIATLHEYLSSHAERIDAKEVLSGYGDREVASAAEILRLGRDTKEMKSFSGHNEGSFYPAFLKDINNAEEEVIIFSPFLEKVRTSQVVPTLRSAIERGVAVRLFTRAYGKGTTAGTLIEELANLPVQIVPNRNLHEKLALIDGRILWAGSLNILSHRETTEVMLRIDSPEITTLLLQYTNAGHQIRQMANKLKRASLLEQIAEALSARMRPPVCRECGKKMQFRVGRYGFFWGCPNYPRDTNTVDISWQLMEEVVEDLAIPCPTEGCEGTMRLRRSKTGVFLGCSEYPDCRTTIPLS